MRDMYECRMLQLDDVKRCQLLEPDVRSNCVALYTFWHAARSAGPHADWPKLLANGMRYDCINSFDGMPAAACDELVKAISATKPALCPTSPAPLKQMCSAVAAADPKLCNGDKDCAELARRLAILERGGGIKRVAKEGTRRDRIHAHATLGDKDACKPEMDAFHKACTSSGGRP